MHNTRMECTVIRNRTGISRRMYPRYELIYSQNNKFLLAAQKVNLIGSAHYTITMDSSSASKKIPAYLGKVRSDSAGTEYNLFSEGENPASTQVPELVRNQLLAIQFVSLEIQCRNNLATMPICHVR